MRRILMAFIALLSFLMVEGRAQEVDLEKGLIGHYDFSEKATDLSGINNHGELIKVNKDEDVTGEKRGSYRINNDKDQIILPIDINPVSLPQVTMMAWVKPMRTKHEMVLLSNDDRGGDRKIYVIQKDGKSVWGISAGEKDAIGKTPVTSGDWAFVAATYDSETNKATIYVNGEKTTGTTKIDRGADRLFVGANPYGNDDFEMLIDEVRVYDRVLSDAELDSLYSSVQPKLKEEKKPKEHFYTVNAKLAARAKPAADGAEIAVLEKGDTLRFTTTVHAAGGKYDEFLEVNIDGKTAYVPLKYLDKIFLEDLEMNLVEKYLSEYMQVNTWSFWIIIVVMLLLGVTLTIFFGKIDGIIGAAVSNDYEGVAVFPMATGLAGFLMPLPVIFWQEDVEYYFNNYSIWPAGYGFAAWVIWSMVLLMFLGFLALLFESFTCGSIAQAIIRMVLQLIIGAMNFISIFVITMAVIIIAIVVIFGFAMLGAAAASMSRRVVRYE